MTSRQIKRQKYSAIRRSAAKHFQSIVSRKGGQLKCEFYLRRVRTALEKELSRFVGFRIAPEVVEQVREEVCRVLESLPRPDFRINIPLITFNSGNGAA